MSRLNVKVLVKRATDMISREAAAVTALACPTGQTLATFYHLSLGFRH